MIRRGVERGIGIAELIAGLSSQVKAKHNDVQDVNCCRVLPSARFTGDGDQVDCYEAEKQILKRLHQSHGFRSSDLSGLSVRNFQAPYA